MAYTGETAAQKLYRCYHCGLESADSSFKYYDNKKKDQPRYKCNHCHKFFTLGLHGRSQGKTYAKKRNEDPEELKNLSRQCRHCGVADNALFKYYNNHNILQPRFKCLSCGKQFQMRVMGIGAGTRLVHTSSAVQARAPRRKKQCVPEPFPNASNGFENGSYQPYDGSLMQVPFDQQTLLQPATSWFEETVIGDDAQYSNICDAELAKPEESYEANFTSCTGNVDNAVPSPVSAEDAEFGDFLEEELLAQDPNEGSNDDALSSTANDTDGLPQTWSNQDGFSYAANIVDTLPQTWSTEDAALMNFTGAGVSYNEAPYAAMVSDNMAEMVYESTSNNGEVMYGTLVSENPVSSSHEPWTWTQNNTSMNPYGVNSADDGATCYGQMDFEMPIESSMEQVDTSVDPYKVNYADNDATKMNLEMPIESSMEQMDASLDPSKMNYAEAAAACCRQMDLEMASMKNSNADSFTEFDWQYCSDSPCN